MTMNSFPNIDSNALYVNDVPDSSCTSNSMTCSLEQLSIMVDEKLPCQITPSTSICSSTSQNSLSSSCSNFSQSNQLCGWGNYTSRKSYSSGLNSLAEGGRTAVEKISSPKQTSRICQEASISIPDSPWGFYDITMDEQ
mmetsp:Transcript_20195/g.19442  ORF Transcript_20195/g.19442 Transcript_20195/m.19442 type:complete len:139 (-) Transcript_20195:188-604(-)